MTKFVGPEIIVWQIGRPRWELIYCLATTWWASPFKILQMKSTYGRARRITC